MQVALVIYEEAPENIRFYSYLPGEEEWALLEQAHGKLVNAHEITGKLLDFMVNFCDNHTEHLIYDSEKKTNLPEPLRCVGDIQLFHFGFAL